MTRGIFEPREFLTDLFHQAVAAADPMKIVAGHLPPRPKGRLIVIGAGKASARMAEAVEAHYGPCEGLVITRYGYARPCAGIEIVEASHPLPDAAGVAATERMMGMVTGLTSDDLVIALISGGGSALLTAPADGLTLDQMIAANAALLASGAPIAQMNAVRKHLCNTKGGGLALACYPARVLGLMISDVAGDDPAMIASGPTVGHSDNANLLEIVARHRLTLPAAVMDALTHPSAKPSRDDRRFANVQNRVIAAPSHSLETAARTAGRTGCDVRILGDAIEGEARELGEAQAIQAMDIRQTMNAGDRPILLVSGGECTVRRCGNGVGGPNAEFVLSAALTLDGAAGVHVLSCDTDGVDGAAEIAGAFAAPDTLAKARALGVSAAAMLDENDAHSFFGSVGGQVVTGPTLTNVNDFRAILIQRN